MDVLRGAKGPIPLAVHPAPAGQTHHLLGILPTLAQVGPIRLVDVGLTALRRSLPDQRLGELKGQVQIEHQVRGGQSQERVFKVKEPVQIGPPLRLRQLPRLVHRVGGGVPVSDQDPDDS